MPNPLLVGLPTQPSAKVEEVTKYFNRGIERLKPNHAGIMRIVGQEHPVNYGVLKTTTEELVYLNTKGLAGTFSNATDREAIVNKIEKQDFEQLIKDGFAERVKLSDIEFVHF